MVKHIANIVAMGFLLIAELSYWIPWVVNYFTDGAELATIQAEHGQPFGFSDYYFAAQDGVFVRTQAGGVLRTTGGAMRPA